MRTQHIGRVVIADAHPLERIGMASVLKSVFHCESIEFASGRTELEQLLARPTELLFLDFELPGLSVDDIQQIRADRPSTRVVVMSSDCSPHTILTILGCSVHGLIPKSLAHSEIVDALQQIAGGYIYVPQCVSEGFCRTPAPEPEGSSNPTRQLSNRQQQVLALASEGKSNKEIARHLKISEATVKVHVSAAFRSMGVDNRVRAVALFQQAQDPQGLLPWRR